MYAHITERGPIRYGRIPFAIGVLEAPGQYPTIGTAFPRGWNEAGLQLWRLTVHDQELPGRFVIIDGEFRPAS
jgi:hypothetical protein